MIKPTHTHPSENVYMNVVCHAWNVSLPISRITHRLHYPMQMPMGNQFRVNPGSHHTTRSLSDNHDRVSSLGNGTFQLTPRVSYTHTKLFGSHRGSLTPNVPGFSPEGINDPFLLRLTHINYISLYALNRESFIGGHPKYQLTTNSSTLMMDDHTHAPTPNMLMSLCICNANVIAISHVTCIMHTT